MKKFALLFLVTLSLFFYSCANTTSAGNQLGGFNGDTSKKSFKAGDYASIFYDITTDVCTRQNGTKAAMPEDDSKGKATFDGVTNDEVRKGMVHFEEFIARNGFPEVKTGDFNVDLQLTDTTIKGKIYSDKVKIDDNFISFNVEYDLYLEDGLWRGKMKGTISIDDEQKSIDYDYDTPILTKLDVYPVGDNGNKISGNLINGGKVKTVIGVNSNAPVDWLNSTIDSPKNNLHGGGGTTYFEKKGNGYWEYTTLYTIYKTQPSGKYNFKYSVRNAARLTSNETEASVNVVNSFDPVKPVITDISVSPEELCSGNGGTVTLSIKAHADCPINWFEYIVVEPGEGNNHGGNGMYKFKDEGNDIYSYSVELPFSKWSPNGTYTIKDILVKTMADMKSEVAEPKTFEIKNNPEAQKPVITDIKIHKLAADEKTVETENVNGLSFTSGKDDKSLCFRIEVFVDSDAPVNYSYSSFDGPAGNISGGGGSCAKEDLGNGKWKVILFSKIESPYYAPVGKYFWQNIKIKNEGRKDSDIWTGDINITLNH